MHRHITLLLLAFSLASCAQSPTGRHTIKLFSNTQLSQMGTQAFAEIKTNLVETHNQTSDGLVQCVARRISAEVPKAVFAGEWEVVVFDDPAVNAFALPGGKIGVYTGLLKVAKNQHQLAAVIGHEVGHVIAEHGNERMSSSTLIGVGMELTNRLLQANKVAANKEIMSAIGLGVQVGVSLPFSRVHETEADIIGLDLMASAGFNPEQAIALWENMSSASTGTRPPQLLSTHPSPSSRIAVLRQHMSAAKQRYRASVNKPDCEP